jgi:hypothetical protein
MGIEVIAPQPPQKNHSVWHPKPSVAERNPYFQPHVYVTINGRKNPRKKLKGLVISGN